MRRWLFVLLLGCFSGQLQASDLSFFAGYVKTETVTLNTTSGVLELDLDDFAVFGVRYEYGFGGIFGVENSLGVTTDSLTLEGPFDSQNGLYYTGNFVINAPLTKVVPNATVGIGYFHRFGESIPPLDNTFLINYGGGLKFREVAGKVGFRIDFRRYYYTDVADGETSSNEISGGVMITF